MSHRTVATIKRPGPHLFVNDPDAPGTCLRCHLLRKNESHVDHLPDTDPAVTALEARRTGDRDGP